MQKRVILVGIYDTYTVSLAPQVLKAYAEKCEPVNGFDIITKEFSIFSDDIETISTELNKLNPDIVGFSMYIWNYNEILEIVKRLKAICVVGGPQVTGIEEELVFNNPQIQFVVTGEGEIVFKELLEYFAGKKSLDTIKGITSRRQKTQPDSFLIDLKSIPSVYAGIFKAYPHITWIYYETSRGCPMGCRFCTWSFSKKMRYLPIENVKEDLKRIFSQENINRLYLCDSSILFNKPRAKEILRYVISNCENKEIIFEFHYEQLDDEIIGLMRRLPNNEYHFGIQTINERALTEMGKAFRREIFEEKYAKMVAGSRRRNTIVDLIYGLPGDDIEGYKMSINYVFSLPAVNRIITNPLIVLPGSYFYQKREELGIKLKDDKSFIISENSTFSRTDMELARVYSFFISVIYLNSSLVDCINLLAKERNDTPMDVVVEFMRGLPFDITGGLGYPYMTPSIKEDFSMRNKVFGNVIAKFDALIECFKKFADSRYDNILQDYRQNYIQHYYRLKKFSENN